MSDSARPHRRQPTRLPHPWESPGKSTGVGCQCLLQVPFFPHLCQYLLPELFSMTATVTGGRWYLMVILICIFLMVPYWVARHVPLGHLHFLFGKNVYSVPLPIFLTGLFGIFSWCWIVWAIYIYYIFYIYIYIRYINPLSVFSFANISISLGHLSVLSMVSFAVQKACWVWLGPICLSLLLFPLL